MKYRIKETINGKGVSTFTGQTKLLWWWGTGMQWSSKELAEKYIRFLQIKEVKYHTVE
jgi:hypothetical protein